MENSKIKWTKHTQNWYTGCTHAKYLDGITDREACLECYAESWSKQTGGKTRPQLCTWGDEHPRHRTSAKYWGNPVKWNAAQAVLGERANVFVDSLSDICDRADPNLDGWRQEAFAIMDQCPNLNWLLLTKRIHLSFECFMKCMPRHWNGKFPSNFWLGVTIESQRAFDEQWPLLAHAANVYGIETTFFSMEPLFERVDIATAVTPGLAPYKPNGKGRFVSWVIIGGESGPRAHVTELENLAFIANQCSRYNRPVFMKQMGKRPTLAGKSIPVSDPFGALIEEMPPSIAAIGQHFPEGAFKL